MFEVETLKYATLATVSRCGMVWFSDDTLAVDMIYQHYLLRLQQDDFDAMGNDPDEKEKREKENAEGGGQPNFGGENKEYQRIRKQCVDSVQSLFDDSEDPSFITRVVELAESLPHIMEFTKIRVLEAFFCLMRKTSFSIFNPINQIFKTSNIFHRHWFVKIIKHSTLANKLLLFF